MANVWKEFSKGLWAELPPFRLLLGLCPTLAVTTKAENGLGMGIAVVFVITLSSFLVSLIRKVIPKKVRIACYITIAASLVVAVELLMQAYAYPLYQQLGIFVPLIVVNCLILGRAEAFAGKNPVHLAVADGLGMGIGFTLSLTFLGAIRELLGTGYVFGIEVISGSFQPIKFMVAAPGAFVALGLILAGMNYLSIIQAKRRGEPAPENPSTGCHACRACAGHK